MNKKFSYIGVALVILIFGIYVVRNFDSRVSQDQVIDDNRLNKVERKTFKSDLVSFHKVPEFQFIDQNGITITNKSYEGKVYVVEFFFTTCPTICPIMNQKMLMIQKDFLNESDFGIASISITPDIDTPYALRQYATQYGIIQENWHLLTGRSNDVVSSLANKGFKLYAGKGDESHGGFEHSGLFALVDKTGVIRSRKDKFGNPIMYYRALEENNFPDQIIELKQDIKKLLHEQTR